MNNVYSKLPRLGAFIAAIAFLAALAGCGSGSGSGSGGGGNPAPRTASLSSIVIAPAAASIPQGTTASFTATGTYSDGSTANLTSQVAWLPASAAVATVNASGTATGLSQGITAITASLSGVTSSSATLTVTASASPTLTSITIETSAALVVSPIVGTLSVPIGAPQQLVAIGTYSNGSTANISVAWSSNNTAVATVNSSGIVFASSGPNYTTCSAISGCPTATITAASGAVSAHQLISVPGYPIAQGGLTWMPVSYINYSWQGANTYCTTTTINGATGWRLPTVAELVALAGSGLLPASTPNTLGWWLTSTWASDAAGTGAHYYVTLPGTFTSTSLDYGPLAVTCVR